MFKKSVDFTVAISLEDARDRLESRINIPILHPRDGLISFSGKEKQGVYKLAYRIYRSSLRVDIQFAESNNGVKVNLVVKPTFVSQMGIVLGCLLMALIGLVVLSKNFLGGSALIAIGLLPLFIKKHAANNELYYVKSRLVKLFEENASK